MKNILIKSLITDSKTTKPPEQKCNYFTLPVNNRISLIMQLLNLLTGDGFELTPQNSFYLQK